MNIITTVNSKLGNHIAQVNMPYIVSCDKNLPCYKDCYCSKGNMNYDNVKKSHMNKYKLYLNNPEGFFNMIDSELHMTPYRYFRWHSSGDIVDEQYLDLMCKLARKHKQTNFLCFTKKYDLVNRYLNHHKKPKNLVLCLSNWGNWIADNPHNLPTSWVAFGDERDENIPVDANECSGHCETCINTSEHCWKMRNGESVTFHKH